MASTAPCRSAPTSVLNTHYTIDTDQGDSVEIVEESSIGEGLKKGEKVLLKVKKEKINVFNQGRLVPISSGATLMKKQ